MIVGNGMIAKVLSDYKEDNSVIIFASGVSNSAEIDEKAYKREEDLLKAYINTKSKLIYFSTCSIFDSSLEKTPYIIHKKRIEIFIKENFISYLILRLPTVIGRSSNPYIFFNFLKNKLINNNPVEVFIKSTRYLLDVEDLSIIIQHLKNMDNQILNVCLDNKSSVKDIVLLMRSELNSNSEILELNKGFDLNIDNKDFIDLMLNQNLIDSKKSANKIISKYL